MVRSVSCTFVSFLLTVPIDSIHPTMPTTKASAAKPAAKGSAATPAPKKGSKKEVPKALAKLINHKRTGYLLSKIKAKAKAEGVDPASLLKRSSKIVVKKIGGDNNGGTRKVIVGKKPKAFYPTEDTPKPRRGRATFQKHKKVFKKGIEPGRVVIILAGRHRGKRVVVLKTLPSGLLLVTGPYITNHCPLRRMHQQYVIVTSTKIDLSSFKLPDNVDDSFFKRKQVKGKKNSEGTTVFKRGGGRYRPNKDKKKIQVDIDRQILTAVKARPDKDLIRAYLGSYFRIRQGVYPHKLKF